MSFFTWMMQFKGDNSDFGDLADDMARSASVFPKDGNHEQILDHLRGNRACREAIATFEDAWKEFTSSSR